MSALVRPAAVCPALDHSVQEVPGKGVFAIDLQPTYRASIGSRAKRFKAMDGLCLERLDERKRRTSLENGGGSTHLGIRDFIGAVSISSRTCT
jgi:hypothetical protein